MTSKARRSAAARILLPVPIYFPSSILVILLVGSLQLLIAQPNSIAEASSVAVSRQQQSQQQQQQQQQLQAVQQQQLQQLGGVTSSGSAAEEEEEYCEREYFEARCSGEDEVIVVRSAIYGRMKLGRCVKETYGSIGCFANVLSLVETICSGRQFCKFPITDLHTTRPCSSELLAYLQASYDCIKVKTCPVSADCSGSFDSPGSAAVGGPGGPGGEGGGGRGVPLPDGSSGILSSLVTATTGCGSPSCPWTLTSAPGQRYNLTFHSYAAIQPDNEEHQTRNCQRMATLLDRQSHVYHDVTVCGRDIPRVTHYLTSSSSTVQLRLFAGTVDNPTHFIVRYEAIGCPDVPKPAGGWVQRRGELVTVGCHHTQRVWHLTCSGVTWIGDVGKCDITEETVVSSNHRSRLLDRVGGTTGGVLLVVGLGVLIGIILGCSMLTIVIVIVKRRHRRRMTEELERRDDELLSHYNNRSTGGGGPQLNTLTSRSVAQYSIGPPITTAKLSPFGLHGSDNNCTPQTTTTLGTFCSCVDHDGKKCFPDDLLYQQRQQSSYTSPPTVAGMSSLLSADMSCDGCTACGHDAYPFETIRNRDMNSSRHMYESPQVIMM